MQRFRIGDTVARRTAGAQVGVIVARDELAPTRLASDPARRFQLGDRVMKSPAAWIANAFDGWGGRGDRRCGSRPVSACRR